MAAGGTRGRLHVALAGPPGDITRAARQALRRAATVVDIDGHATVAAVVLVNPTVADWQAARAAARPIIAVVGHDLSVEQVATWVLWGAEAVVPAGQVAGQLTAVVRAVLRGATVLSSAETRALAVTARAIAAKAQPALTGREREIAALIAEGLTVKQTAAALGIAPKTVENLQGRLFRKLGVRNRAQATASLSTGLSALAIPQSGVGEIPR